MKKIISVLLALVMVMSLAVTAFAAESKPGSITIDNAVKDQTYSVYKILDLESYNETAKAYSYKASSKWDEFVSAQNKFFAVDEAGYVTWVEGASAAELAKAAQAYAKENGIAAETSQKATGTTVTFSNLDLGYYMVGSTQGSLCALDTTNPSVVMKEKNSLPSLDKYVQEDSTGVYGKTNDADIGQTVYFKAVIDVRYGNVINEFRDLLSDGLTFKAIDSVTITRNNETITYPADKYTKVTESDTVDYTFMVLFDAEYQEENFEGNEVITIIYTAEININGVIGGEGNDNEAEVRYTHNGEESWTPKSTTKTYTWAFEIVKYGNNDTNNLLEGAKFIILNKDQSMVAEFDENGLFGTWVSVDGITDFSEFELVTGKNGKIQVAGLDADTYYLQETEAPAGYNKLTENVEVVITRNVDEEGMTMSQDAVASQSVNNNSGTELPETGGMGTTLFYVLGSVMVLGAAVLLVTKKRMGAAD